MKKPIALAIFGSALMIAAALFVTYRKNEEVIARPTLVAENYLDKIPDASAPTSTSTSTAVTAGETKPASGTDLIGRQLILDYIELARSGGVTQDNLGLLAERYINSIPTLVAPKKITLIDIKAVSTNRENISSYAREIRNAYRNYTSSMIGSYSEDAQDITNPKSKEMFESMSKIYFSIAETLSAMKVPGELAEDHLLLANTYFENSAAAKALAAASTDPASAFAGLIFLSENAEKENNTMTNIENFLSENGI